MTPTAEKPPRVVAAANLSPLSPSPVHTAPPAVVPDLQERADTLDVASLDSLTSPAPLSAANPASAAGVSGVSGMAASNPADSAGIIDTIVVGGDYSEESPAESVADDDSFDAYGEDDDGEQAPGQPGRPAGTATDDYAHTFDSPAREQPEPEPDLMDVSSAEGDGTVELAKQPELDEPAPEPQPKPKPHAAPQPDVSAEPVNDFFAPDAEKESQSHPPEPASALSALPSAPEPALALSPAPSPDTTFAPAIPAAAAEGGSNSDSTPPLTAAPAEPDSGPAGVSQSGSPPADDASSEASASASATAAPASASGGDETSPVVDIEKLVNDITARAIVTSAAAAPPPPQSHHSSPPPPSEPSQPASASKLFPIQPPSEPAALRRRDSRPSQFQTAPRGPYMSAGPPSGADGDTHLAAAPVSSENGPVPDASPTLSHAQQQAWEQFQIDEKHYLADAKWDRFPDGSRIFIGNLSSERVSKSEVFSLFHKFGRLAQISLKNAYGFAQFHSVADAQAAMEHAQGAELGGRKIHLEFSRVQQKKKDEKDRSPDRRNNQRGDRAGRGSDRYDGRDTTKDQGRDQGRRGRDRDDYRPGGRKGSPRRDEAPGRGRNRRGLSTSDRRFRDRSRSPQRHSGRYDGDQYRRRSRSARRPSRSEADRPDHDRLDVPRRYGDQVPDVQLLLLHEVEREFVAWVQQAFSERSLKSDVMFLNPRFPQDAVLQRQILEGVHGIVELDVAAQSTGRIPIKVFDRSAGVDNVRFDQYQDLDPKIAAELVCRTKAAAVSYPSYHHLQQQQQQQQPMYPPAAHYGQQPPSYGFPGQPAGYPSYPANSPPSAAPPQAPPVQDITASLAGHLDPSTLQAVLASLHAGQGGVAAAPAMQPVQPATAAPQPLGFPPFAAAQEPQVDLSAVLSSLNGSMAAPTPTLPQYPASAGMAGGYGVNHSAYPPPMATGGSNHNPAIAGAGAPPHAAFPNGDADTAQQVQNIMATLARYRQ